MSRARIAQAPYLLTAWQVRPTRFERLLGRTWVVVAIQRRHGIWAYDEYVPRRWAQDERKGLAAGRMSRREAERFAAAHNSKIEALNPPKHINCRCAL